MALHANSVPPLLYSVRRSCRAKRVRIIVKADKVEVVAPPKVSEHRIKAFVDAHQEWIKAAVLRVIAKADAVPTLAPAVYQHGVQIPFQGRQIPLSLLPSQARTVRLQLEPEAGFMVTMPGHVDSQQISELIRQILIRWMKNQARIHATQLIDKHAPSFGLFPKSLKIKTQKSRWGSCGPNNDVNLNWLLMLAPPQVMEYVVVHELCHIKHKNHSKDFWGLVAAHLPDYLVQRSWLKQHGASLMRGL